MGVRPHLDIVFDYEPSHKLASLFTLDPFFLVVVCEGKTVLVLVVLVVEIAMMVCHHQVLLMMVV